MKLDHAEFSEFWARYPRRVAKIAAMKAYVQARKLATAAEILAGLERYRRTMPDDPQYRPHASTWLHQGRWMDEDEVDVRPVPEYWADECQRLHGGSCTKRWNHEIRKRDEPQQEAI